MLTYLQHVFLLLEAVTLADWGAFHLILEIMNTYTCALDEAAAELSSYALLTKKKKKKKIAEGWTSYSTGFPEMPTAYLK